MPRMLGSEVRFQNSEESRAIYDDTPVSTSTALALARHRLATVLSWTCPCASAPFSRSAPTLAAGTIPRRDAASLASHNSAAASILFKVAEAAVSRRGERGYLPGRWQAHLRGAGSRSPGAWHAAEPARSHRGARLVRLLLSPDDAQAGVFRTFPRKCGIRKLIACCCR